VSRVTWTRGEHPTWVRIPHVADGFEGYNEDPPRSLLKNCNIGLNFLLQNPHILVKRMVARALKFKCRESGPAPEWIKMGEITLPKRNQINASGLASAVLWKEPKSWVQLCGIAALHPVLRPNWLSKRQGPGWESNRFVSTPEISVQTSILEAVRFFGHER
jgi:hypothetical protein